MFKVIEEKGIVIDDFEIRYEKISYDSMKRINSENSIYFFLSMVEEFR